MWWREVSRAINRTGEGLAFLPKGVKIFLAKHPWYRIRLGRYQPIVFQFFNGLLKGMDKEVLVDREIHRFGGGYVMRFKMECDLRSYVGRKYYYSDEDYWFGRELGKRIKAGEIYWDVGASIGYTSLIAARYGARVVAFEPEEYAYGRLLRNIELNKQFEMRAIKVAASDRSGKASLHLSRQMDGGHSIEPGYMRAMNIPETGNCIITTKRLDEMALETPSVIKIDVEGHELPVLRGLKRFMPTIKCVFCETTMESLPEVRDTLGNDGFDAGVILDKLSGKYERTVAMKSPRLIDTIFVKKQL